MPSKEEVMRVVLSFEKLTDVIPFACAASNFRTSCPVETFQT